MPMTFSGRLRKANQMSYAIAIKAIITQPHSLAQLMELTGLSKRSVVDLLKALQSQKLIHTAAWGPDAMGRFVLNVWGWGICLTFRGHRPRPLLSCRRNPVTESASRRKQLARSLHQSLGL